jgi:hypothetical protein
MQMKKPCFMVKQFQGIEIWRARKFTIHMRIVCMTMIIRFFELFGVVFATLLHPPNRSRHPVCEDIFSPISGISERICRLAKIRSSFVANDAHGVFLSDSQRGRSQLALGLSNEVDAPFLDFCGFYFS